MIYRGLCLSESAFAIARPGRDRRRRPQVHEERRLNINLYRARTFRVPQLRSAVIGKKTFAETIPAGEARPFRFEYNGRPNRTRRQAPQRRNSPIWEQERGFADSVRQPARF